MQYFYANFRYFAIIVVNYVYFILLMSGRMQTNLLDLLRRNQVYSKQAALKKGSSIECYRESREQS